MSTGFPSYVRIDGIHVTHSAMEGSDHHMTNTPENITDEERSYLEQILQEAKARKAEALKKQGMSNTDGHQRKELPKEEYVKRLKQARQKDAQTLQKLQQARANKSFGEWQKLVGHRFAQAETNHPVILERVDRLKSRQGVHKTSVVLQGAYGRGKTWHAYGYIARLIQEGVNVPGQIVHGTEVETIASISNSGFERDQKRAEFLKRASKKVFFIDDVGTGYYFKREHREETWYDLIDHIYRNRLTIIMTTNLEFTQSGHNSLGDWIGHRAFDRLRELVGPDGVLRVDGENKRERTFHENETEYRQNKKNNTQQAGPKTGQIAAPTPGKTPPSASRYRNSRPPLG